MDIGKFRTLALPAYLIATLVVVIPFAEGVITVLPLRPGAVAWRFGAAGVLSSSLLTPLLGLLLLAVIALLLDHRIVLRAVAVVSALSCLLLIGSATLFVLDAVQLRTAVVAEAKETYDAASVQALLKQCAVLAGAAALAVAAWRASKPKRAREDHNIPLVSARKPDAET
jgi:hypothetical protein